MSNVFFQLNTHVRIWKSGSLRPRAAESDFGFHGELGRVRQRSAQC